MAQAIILMKSDILEIKEKHSCNIGRSICGRSETSPRLPAAISALRSRPVWRARLMALRTVACCQSVAVLVAVLSNAEAEWALGQPLALTDYLATANCLRRLLTSLGLERSAKAIPGESPDLIGDGP